MFLDENFESADYSRNYFHQRTNSIGFLPKIRKNQWWKNTTTIEISQHPESRLFPYEWANNKFKKEIVFKRNDGKDLAE